MCKYEPRDAPNSHEEILLERRSQEELKKTVVPGRSQGEGWLLAGEQVGAGFPFSSSLLSHGTWGKTLGFQEARVN